jgi:acyl-CoA synthetase (AMP-forming)/AMP-acid ligase II
LVVCESKIELNKKELREFLLTVLPPQKLPNKIIQVAELPRTLAGKIDFKAFSKRPVEEEHADA